MANRTLAFLGDIMLGRGVDEVVAARPPEWPWGTTLPVLMEADAVFANLECAVTDHARPWTRTYKVFHFRARPHAIPVLTAGGIDCVSLANNHTLDFEEGGLLDTLARLDAAGIAHAGAGRTFDEARQPIVVDAGGLKIGFLALTDNEPPFAASATAPGTWYSPMVCNAAVLTPIRKAIAAVRAMGAELVVLSVHWGPNMVVTPPVRHRNFAATVLEMGVDILHGHSAHLFQGVVANDHRLVLYDTGDFLDDYAVDPDLPNDWSFIFLVDVADGRLERLRLYPVRLDYAQTNLATEDEAASICARMERLSSALGSRLHRCRGGLELGLG